MFPSVEMENNTILDTATRLSALSIVVDDFDLGKTTTPTREPKKEEPEEGKEVKECKVAESKPQQVPCPQKPYSRQSSDASIKKILDEAEHRKHEFWKLIDEHNAVIENLKKIEQLENAVCKVATSPIKT